MNTLQKEARRDAFEYARAAMAHGDGAGVRRRLIQATVEDKCERSERYQRAFEAALAEQDMAEHADAARKERRRTDRNEAVVKNTKGLLTGNYQGVHGGILIAAAVTYVAHQTGYDRKALAYGRKKYQKGKAYVTMRYRMHKANIKPVD